MVWPIVVKFGTVVHTVHPTVVKIWTYENPTAILKIEKKREISITVSPIATKFGMETHISPLHPINS